MMTPATRSRLRAMRIRSVRSPLTAPMLVPLEPDCDAVRITGTLGHGEAARLGELLSGRRDVKLIVKSDYGARRPVRDLDFLRSFPWLSEVFIFCDEIETLDGLRHLSAPRRLCIGGAQAMSTVPAGPLAAAAGSLRELTLEIPVSEVAALSELTALEELSLRKVRIPGLSMLAPVTGLRSLSLTLGALDDLNGLPVFTGLQDFSARLVSGLADVAALAEVPSLETVWLEELSKITELPALNRLSRLRRIRLDDMRGLKDLRPLLTAPALEEVVIRMHHLQPEDVAPLAAHPTLRRVHISLGSTQRDALAQAAVGLPE
jgi:hypothetical protein